MTIPKAPLRPRGWIEAIREAALRFDERLSQPAFLHLTGKPTTTTRPPARPAVRVSVGTTRQTG